MPTSTFYHLPEQKRQKLIEAIRQEILRVPYEKISINKDVYKRQVEKRSGGYGYTNGILAALRLLDVYKRQSLLWPKAPAPFFPLLSGRSPVPFWGRWSHCPAPTYGETD